MGILTKQLTGHVISIALKKAFDTLDHQTLEKLEFHGYKGAIFEIKKSYLVLQGSFLGVYLNKPTGLQAEGTSGRYLNFTYIHLKSLFFICKTLLIKF